MCLDDGGMVSFPFPFPYPCMFAEDEVDVDVVDKYARVN